MFKSILNQVKKEKTKSTTSEQKISDIEDLMIKQTIIKEVNFENQVDFPLNQYRIANQEISTVYYIPQYITLEQQEYLMNSIYNNPSRFNTLIHAKRRVQKYGGDVNPTGLENVEQLPQFIIKVKNMLETSNLIDKPINHALINEYERGTGIMGHTDGPLYYHIVTIISLGSSCIFKFTKSDKLLLILVEPMSLLIFTDEAYRDWLHAIDYYDEDTILFNFKDKEITDSNVQNFKNSSWGVLVKNKLNEGNNIEEEQIKNEEFIGTLIQLKNNNYQYALLLRRNLRLSMTLRHAWLPEEYQQVIKQQ